MFLSQNVQFLSQDHTAAQQGRVLESSWAEAAAPNSAQPAQTRAPAREENEAAAEKACVCD